MGTEHKRFDMLNAQRPMSCHLLSVVVVYPSPASTSSLSQVCLGLCYLQITCRKLPAIPYPSFLHRHLGFLHRMGTAEGAVGQASPRLSHHVYSHPPDLTSPSVPTRAPSSTETPKPEGSVCPWGQDRGGGTGAVWLSPQPLQSTDAFERASQTLLAFT